MSRDLKPYKVDQVRTDLITLDVMFDRNRKDFFVMMNADTVRAPSIAEVKKLGYELIERCKAYEWTQLIEITIPDAEREVRRHGEEDKNHRSHQLTFEFQRYERSPHPHEVGKFVKRPFGSKATSARPRNVIGGKDDYVTDWYQVGEDERLLPYDERTWTGLCAILEAVHDIRKKLHALGVDKKLVAKLQAFASGNAHVAKMLEGKK